MKAITDKEGKEVIDYEYDGSTECIIPNGLPIEVEKPKKEFLEALEEGEEIIQEIKEGKIKRYNNMTDLINSLNNK